MNILSSKINHTIWHQFSSVLIKDGVECHFLFDEKFDLLLINNHALIINLISSNNQFNAGELISLQEKYLQENIKLIHLWEDVWLSRPNQVLSRIKSLLGLNLRIHGRKTKVEKVTKPVADAFLQTNHLQGAVNSRYKLGLFLNEELVAVATFSALRKMRHSDDYKSAELIRFAVKAGYSITGGLSKLISNFKNLVKPNDIMTYADKDWSAGEAYLKLGFEKTGNLDAQSFVVDDEFKRRLNTDNQIKTSTFNTGSIKFILRF